MLANKRYNLIADIIRQKGEASVAELAKITNVSTETVRRDLLSMENKGLLQRVHGGAVAVGEMMHYHELSERKEENVEEKIKLAKTTAGLVEDGDIIFIDSGTTPVHFAKAIKDKKITVITCSLEVFNELKAGNAQVILSGGEYKSSTASFCGELALSNLRKLCANKAFIYPSAVSLRHGVCDFSLDTYAIQTEILKHADKIYIVATSNKFEKNGLLKICEMTEEYVYVTDGGLKKEHRQLYEENGLTVII